MKLSIVVPVFNMAAGRKLEYCLDSLLEQRVAEYEIICVDDCSTDESMQILKKYEENYPTKIRVFQTPENRKQGGARNYGMQYALGEWIGFFDSDDFAAEDMYEKLLKKAEETGADVVGCQYQITDKQSKEPGRIVINNTAEQTGVLGVEQYKLLMRKPGSMVIKIYKKEVIDRYQLKFPERVFYEDNCAAPVWMLHFKHYELVDEPLYYYYQHEASTVHHLSRAKCEDRMTTGKMLVDWCKEAGFYEPYKAELEYRFTELYYVNTLFSYVVSKERVQISFLKEMATGMQEEFPDFQENPYFVQAYDAEQKRLIGYHMKSSLFFLLYYRALNGYRALKKAFIDTIPVLTGYLVLGFGFGIILKANGYGILMAFAMSLMIYAGSMQYVAIGLLTGGASLITAALTTLMVNARHLFYGISMLDKYKNTGKRKPYLIFALTDETYSLVCNENPDIPEKDRNNYYLFVSLFDQIYWILGSLLGAAVGSIVKFNSEGIDFALTALFLTVFLEQWLTTKNHAPAITGVVVSVVCLVIFGGDKFLIPTMLVIALLLCLYKPENKDKQGENG